MQFGVYTNLTMPFIYDGIYKENTARRLRQNDDNRRSWMGRLSTRNPQNQYDIKPIHAPPNPYNCHRTVQYIELVNVIYLQ